MAWGLKPLSSALTRIGIKAFCRGLKCVPLSQEREEQPLYFRVPGRLEIFPGLWPQSTLQAVQWASLASVIASCYPNSTSSSSVLVRSLCLHSLEQPAELLSQRRPLEVSGLAEPRSNGWAMVRQYQEAAAQRDCKLSWSNGSSGRCPVPCPMGVFWGWGSS